MSLEYVARLYGAAAAESTQATRLRLGQRAAQARQREQEEAQMRTPRYGRISPATYDAMAASLPEKDRAVLRLLTDTPQEQQRVMARAAAADAANGWDDPEFAALFPPETAAEAERRERHRIAASAQLSEDELYEAIFGRNAL